MNILGISAFYHDSAAALVRDGQIIAAAQEERFTRKKHDASLPAQSIAYCLEAAGIGPADLDYVVFYEKPLVKFERLLETYLAYAPRGYRQFLLAMPQWLGQKLYIPRQLDKALQRRYRGPFLFTEHHEAHAASAFFPSPFEQAAILTFDGVGEWHTASFGAGMGNKIKISHVLNFPHSLGMLYSAFTYFTGFKVNSGEYKLMGLAPYGQPRYADLILEKLMDLKPDGSFRLDMDYFAYCHKTVMTNRRFERLFGGPPRTAEAPLTQREMDLAASVQAVTEEVVMRAARHVHEQTGMSHLVLAGGVALNCVANGRLLREGPFEDIWIQPAAGDAGGALGAALFVWHHWLDNQRTLTGQDQQQGSLLGPSFGNGQIRDWLEQSGAAHLCYDKEADLLDEVAQLIAQGKVVGWFAGRMEYGPRALGSRSILGDARNTRMQSTLNLKIKFRESFRPFAPAVLAQDCGDYFDWGRPHDSPYMLLVAPVVASKRLAPAALASAGHGLDMLKAQRSVVPAITHVDYSARVQTVDAQRHGRFYRLLTRFKELTGCPLLINTSFNIRGEPIVCTPQDAFHCFMHTDMDVLVLENYVLYKDQQKRTDDREARSYQESFVLD